jgi:hypothetical protein
MANAPVGHKFQALFNIVFASDGYEFRRHHLPHLGVLREFPFQDKSTRVIALGENPDRFTGIEHQQCADVFFAEQLKRFKNRGLQRSTFVQLLDFRLDFLQKVSVQSQLHFACGALEDEALNQEVNLKFIFAAA